jgi:SAM-dependent methyltransferase
VTLARLAEALWTRSPREIMSAARRRLNGAAPTDVANGAIAQGYHAWLVDELYAFVAANHPREVLPRERFRALIARYQDPNWLRATNRYLGDLWYLFAPDYATRLPEYYQSQELPLLMTLLSYAANPPLLESNYVEPYRLARQRLGRLSVLEFGAGLPHGLLWHVHRDGTSWCSRVTAVDIDATPARFLAFWCERHRLAHTSIASEAGATVNLSTIAKADFVFAKDVFEHLSDPAGALEQVLTATAPRAVLALDLDDKGDVEYQHVSPRLQQLVPAVEHAGFALLGRTGNLSIFARG